VEPGVLGTRGHGILVERALCDCAGELEGGWVYRYGGSPRFENYLSR
jgi:hypothetical protein